MNEPTWTYDRVKELKAWVAQRKPWPTDGRKFTPSYEEIATRMGLTKGMVIGMAQRIEKGTAVVYPNPTGGTQPARIRPPKPSAVATPPTRIPESALTPLGELKRPRKDGTCGYIYGDPKQHDWRYCGRKVVRHGLFTAWCDGHRKVVYTPAYKSARKAEQLDSQ